MVSPCELKDEEECEDILEDIIECNKYEVVLKVDILRPIEGVNIPGCGKNGVKPSRVLVFITNYNFMVSNGLKLN